MVQGEPVQGDLENLDTHAEPKAAPRRGRLRQYESLHPYMVAVKSPHGEELTVYWIDASSERIAARLAAKFAGVSAGDVVSVKRFTAPK